MTWRPMTEQHAIERVRVSLTFERPIPPKMVRALGARLDGRLQGLGFAPIAMQSGQGIVLQLGPAGPIAVQQPQELSGWTFQLAPMVGATPVEVFQLAENALIYEVAEYSRWPVFIDRFDSVTSEVVRDLLTLDDPTLALEYHDRFWFDGPLGEAAPSLFLSVAETLVPPTAQSGAELWHVHRGWFEPTPPHGRLLMQHSMDAQEEVVQGQPRRVIRVTTRAIGQKGAWTIAEDSLQPHLDIMHDRTKKVFADTLTPEMRRLVGIEPENQ